MEIPHNKWAIQRNLKLDKGFRDALADLWRARWPSNTAKHAARAYGLSLDRAREGVAGRASLTTLEQVVKSGGVLEGVMLIEAVAGQTLSQAQAELRKSHDEQGRRIAALVSNPFALGADRRSGDPDHDGALAGRPGTEPHRAAGDRR